MDFLINWFESFGIGNFVLMGIILGGMMVIDMGGLFNKVVFMFGIVMIDVGNYVFYVVIMVGGMVFLFGIVFVIIIF